MNIYKVFQAQKVPNANYYKIMIVIADDTEEALATHPDGQSIRSGDKWGKKTGNSFHETPVADYTWPMDLSKLEVEHIGVAAPTMKKGVILALM